MAAQSELAKAYLGVYLDRKGLNKDLAQLKSDLARQMQGLVRGVRVPMKIDTSGVRSSMSQVRSSVLGTFRQISTVAGGILAAVGITSLVQSVKDLAGAMVSGNASMEQYQISFEVLLKSADKARQMIADIQQFAAKTPFEIPGLVQSSQMLLNYGFEAQRVLPMLKNIGDAASASPEGMSQAISRITRALGQMRARGKVSAQEMLQLTEAGIPAWELLEKQLGKSAATLMKMGEQGKLKAGPAIDALLKGMEQKYGGMMEKQAKSFTGMMSTLRDNVAIALKDIGKPIFELAKVWLSNLLSWMDSDKGKAFTEGLKEGMERVVESIKLAKQYYTAVNKRVQELVRAHKDVIVESLKFTSSTAAVAAGVFGVIKAVRLLKLATLASLTAIRNAMLTNPFTAIVIGISAAVVAVIRYRDQINKVIDKSPMLSRIRDSFYRIADSVRNGAAAAVQYFLDVWKEVEPTMMRVYAVSEDCIGRIFAWIKSEVTRNQQYWSQWKDLIVGYYKNLLETALNVFDGIRATAISAATKIGEVWDKLFGTDFVSWLETTRDNMSEFFFWSVTAWLESANKMADSLSLLTTNFKKSWTFIKAGARTAFWDIVDHAVYMGKNLVNLVEAYQSGAKAALEAGVPVWGGFFRSIIELAQAATNAIVGNMVNTVKGYFGAASAIIDKIKEAFSESAGIDAQSKEMARFNSAVQNAKDNIANMGLAFSSAFQEKRNEMPLFRHSEEYNKSLEKSQAAWQAMVDERDRQRREAEAPSAVSRIPALGGYGKKSALADIPRLGGKGSQKAAVPTLSGIFGLDSIFGMIPKELKDKAKAATPALLSAIGQVMTGTPKPGGGPPRLGDVGERKVKHFGLADYAMQMQEAIGKNSTQDRIASSTAETAKAAKETAQGVKELLKRGNSGAVEPVATWVLDAGM